MARILGLDIGEHHVWGVILKASFRKVELEQYIEIPRVGGATDPASRAESAKQAIEQLIAASGKPPDRIIASLDGKEASLRIVSLPAGAAKRAAEVLPFELEPLLPFAPEEAIVDYQPIDQIEGEVRLLAAAVPKDKIATRLAELADAGVDPRELAVGAAALDGLGQLLPQLQSAAPMLIVEVANDETNLCMMKSGRCEMVRTLSSGVRDVESGRLEAELKRTLVAYRAGGGVEPERVFLAGEVAGDPNAPAWLAEKLGTEVSQLPLPPGPGAGEGGIGRFGRAAALAARTASRDKRIDLRKGEFTPTQAMGAVAQNAKLIAACAGIVLFAFMFSIYARWAVLSDEREALGAELERVTEASFGMTVDSPQRARELLERGPRTRDPLPRFDSWDILDAISTKIPDEITHDTRRLHIELDEDGWGASFVLEGHVGSVQERDQIAELLEEHECVREIEKGQTAPGRGGEGTNYELEGTIRCPGAPAPAESDRRRRNR